jgi:hypothetical protein
LAAAWHQAEPFDLSDWPLVIHTPLPSPLACLRPHDADEFDQRSGDNEQRDPKARSFLCPLAFNKPIAAGVAYPSKKIMARRGVAQELR